MARHARSRAESIAGAALLAVIVTLAAGCPGPADRPAGGDARDRRPDAAGARHAPGVAPRMPSRDALRPEDLLRPRWPAGWTVAEATAAGPKKLPVISWRLEARNEAPERAARAALDALRPLAGEIVLDDVHAEPGRDDEPARAIGQLRGSRLRAGVLAIEARGASEITVTVERLPGP